MSEVEPDIAGRQRELAKKMGLSDQLMNMINPPPRNPRNELFDFDEARRRRKAAKAARRKNRKK